MTGRLTVAQAAERLFGDRSVRHTRAILRLVALGADGPFPGAAKLDPNALTSPFTIPLDEIVAYEKKQKSAK